jgi:DNA repair exonuclease SbcCD ATPase subunit
VSRLAQKHSSGLPRVRGDAAPRSNHHRTESLIAAVMLRDFAAKWVWTIAGQKRLEQQVNEASARASEWERRTDLARRAGGESLVAEAQQRVSEAKSQHGRLSRHLERATEFVNAEKERLRKLTGACTEMTTLVNLIDQEIARADTTRAPLWGRFLSCGAHAPGRNRRRTLQISRASDACTSARRTPGKKATRARCF